MQNMTLSGDISESKSTKKKSRKKRKSARSFIDVDNALAAPLLGPKLTVEGWNASASASEVVSGLASIDRCWLVLQEILFFIGGYNSPLETALKRIAQMVSVNIYAVEDSPLY